MKTIDLNVDIGEGFPFDEALLEFATSANICCGSHAGSKDLTQETVELCVRRGVRIGAHPGYPDRETMGRKPLDEEHLRPYLKSLFDQMQWFTTIAKPAYLKPHGGFYNDTALILPWNWQTQKRTRETYLPYDTGGLYLAQFPGVQSLQMLLRVHKLPLMGLAATAHAQIAERSKHGLIKEGFADRRYTSEGQLTPRSEPGAILHDMVEIQAQVLRLAEAVDSICLHGDTPGCLEFAEVVVKTLRDAGYEIGK